MVFEMRSQKIFSLTLIVELYLENLEIVPFVTVLHSWEMIIFTTFSYQFR